MRYQGGSIKNVYCYHPLSTMSQSVEMYDHNSPIGQNFLLILAQTQYPLKVESPYNKLAW